MTPPERARSRGRAEDGSGASWLGGRAFGVDVRTTVSIPELPPRLRGRGNPRTTLEAADSTALTRAWPAGEAEVVFERVRLDGRPMMVVEQHPQLGFHISAPRYGRHLVSADGAHIRSALPAVSPWRWERLLFAQVLPLAAALRGRDLFHASAVALDGAAFGFVGLSRAGKSSIAAHLVAGGASLVTDDVLALERTRGGVRAHPGTGLAGVHQRELTAMSASGRARLGRPVGKADKTYLAGSVVDAALPLRGLYFITRGTGRDVEIGSSESVPTRLLGSSFIAYLRAPEHLVEHLEVCTHIAETVPVLELAVPGSVQANDVARAVAAHARGLAAAM